MKVYSDPHIPIKVSIDQTFAISLKAVPSTGYSWKPEYDSKIIEHLNADQPEFIPCSSAIGGGGKEILKFKARQIGETQIKIKYKRVWETTYQEIKIFKVYVEQI